MRTIRHSRVLGLVLMLTLVSACVPPPVTLSPVGAADFNKTRVIKSLDVLRDIAVDANALVPPLIQTATTRKVVVFHRSALVLIDAGPGWKSKVLTALDEVTKDLPPPEVRLIAPYVQLSKILIAEVGQ